MQDFHTHTFVVFTWMYTCLEDSLTPPPAPLPRLGRSTVQQTMSSVFKSPLPATITKTDAVTATIANTTLAATTSASSASPASSSSTSTPRPPPPPPPPQQQQQKQQKQMMCTGFERIPTISTDVQDSRDVRSISNGCSEDSRFIRGRTVGVQGSRVSRLKNWRSSVFDHLRLYVGFLSWDSSLGGSA